MNESARTGVFVTLAIASLGVAYLARPATPTRTEFDDAGERFFAEADPLLARSLEVISFDETAARAERFKVAQENGLWVIPSHENYPADAEEHLARAAASVLDLVKGPKVSDRAIDHETFGVVDPLDAPAGASGIGTRVTITDGGGDTMADFIIGKSVKDATNLRYVRVPERDRVYTTAVDTTALTTRFQDWIEEDLLRLDPWAIKEIVINDYTIDEFNQRLVQGELVELAYDEDLEKWSLASLAESEQLVTAPVDAMKTALDDLTIIDVHRKPEGLSAELRTADALQLDAQAIGSLSARGFYITNNMLVSNQGELIVKMKSGVMYVLRFGEVALGERDASALDETDETDTAPTGTPAARYLFVMAEFDPTLIDVPAATPPAETADDEEAEGPVEDTPDPRAEAIAAGRRETQALNERFADWYYVISDEVYRKLRLTRADLVEPVGTEVETTPSG
ncbi:MAG: DUF4340 domain-containing protein [Phycisphaerales bacterium]|nr:DUF4340 domain-containing protein [Phycisphaerae bacterium]NNF42271.1 DUF4340 domain-containing protein [Phycisphaerales bacterium]NNM25392.1 DUF4340 domain-containing protein [Phycisphaerales bacterium]